MEEAVYGIYKFLSFILILYSVINIYSNIIFYKIY